MESDDIRTAFKNGEYDTTIYGVKYVNDGFVEILLN